MHNIFMQFLPYRNLANFSWHQKLHNLCFNPIPDGWGRLNDDAPPPLMLNEIFSVYRVGLGWLKRAEFNDISLVFSLRAARRLPVSKPRCSNVADGNPL